MKEHYESLMRKFSDRYGREAFDGFSQTSAMRGQSYMDHSWRMMVVERTADSWEPVSPGLTPSRFGIEMEKRFLEDDGSVMNGFASRYMEDEPWSLRKSKFWNYAEDVWKALDQKYAAFPVPDDEIGENWYEWVAWSTLYKIAEKGNPHSIMNARLQAWECREILREEFDEYRPSLILMEQDSSWFTVFSSLFSSIEVRAGNIVRITASYRGIPVIVAVNPDNVKKNDFVSAVVSAADYLYRY